MLKKFSYFQRKIVISSFIAFLLVCGWARIASAQASLPAGGSSFETAVRLETGDYQGGVLGKYQELYYYIQGKAGQEVRINSEFLPGGLFGMFLYDENEKKLSGEDYSQDIEASWLANADASQYKYYLKILSREWQADSFSLEISLTDYYDANSQVDAGDDFDGALAISPGDYDGYLSGYPYIVSGVGDDLKDYYKVPVQKGATYEFRLTPPSTDNMDLELFSLDRSSIKNEESDNPGAIVSFSLTPSIDTYVFLRVGYSPRTGEEIVDYGLSIESSAPLIKFYGCEEKTCEFLGEYSSLQECQESTAKICYQSVNCNEKCGQEEAAAPGTPGTPGTPGIPGVPGSTSSACENECSLGQAECFDNFNYQKCGNFDDDECLEWSTPVYCGQDNGCENGECVPVEGCRCSAWADEECGESGCQEDEMYQTRSCEPKNCDQESQCLVNTACSVAPPLSSTPSVPSDLWLLVNSFIGKWTRFVALYLLLLIPLYVYFALCLQFLAKKTNTPNGWLAWIPIADIFLMLNIAGKPLWWFILLLIPIVNIVIGVIIWMAIAERVGKPSWLGLLTIVPVIGIVIPGYLAFAGGGKSEKMEVTPPYSVTGTMEADKPVVGYKHPCKYCEKLIPPNSSICPYCGKANPLGPLRCPRCHEPVKKDWMVCPNCDLNLRIICPFCGKTTFFGDYCEDCGKRLMVTCPHCGQEQPPISDHCVKCGKPLFETNSK